LTTFPSLSTTAKPSPFGTTFTGVGSAGSGIAQSKFPTVLRPPERGVFSFLITVPGGGP
jgi:hypothetical protein